MILAELNQSRLKGGQRFPIRRLREVLSVCSRMLGVHDCPRVSIGFVSPSRMRQLNRQWRGKDRVTDVLAFAFSQGSLKGEILLNYEQAAKQARGMRHGVREEVCFLLVHGLLHVFGYEHDTARAAKRLFALQIKIVTALHVDPRL